MLPNDPCAPHIRHHVLGRLYHKPHAHVPHVIKPEHIAKPDCHKVSLSPEQAAHNGGSSLPYSPMHAVRPAVSGKMLAATAGSAAASLAGISGGFYAYHHFNGDNTGGIGSTHNGNDGSSGTHHTPTPPPINVIEPTSLAIFITAVSIIFMLRLPAKKE